MLRANGRAGLRTVVVTPHAVIGARDAIYLEAHARAVVAGAFTPRLAKAGEVRSKAAELAVRSPA